MEQNTSIIMITIIYVVLYWYWDWLRECYTVLVCKVEVFVMGTLHSLGNDNAIVLYWDWDW